MKPSRAAVMVVGANLIAVWIAAAAGRSVPAAPEATGQAVSVDQAVEQARSAFAAATVRLETHQSQQMAGAIATRNPFHFGGWDRPAPVGAAPTDAPPSTLGRPAVTPESAPAELELAGMAETQDGDAVQRTAIMTAGGELVLATIGMEVAGRFRVTAISADSVDLDDLRGGPPVTVRLKSS